MHPRRQPAAMLSKPCNDDDFAALFLMMSGRTPLLACLMSETRLRGFMSSLEKRLRYRRIPRCALVDARQSSCQCLFLSRNDQAFITFTGLVFSNFQYVLNKFTPLYNREAALAVLETAAVTISIAWTLGGEDLKKYRPCCCTTTGDRCRKKEVRTSGVPGTVNWLLHQLSVNGLKRRWNYHPHWRACCEALRLDSPKVGCREQKKEW
jgi:hypothetical protein